MLAMNETDVRRNWSEVLERVIHNKPAFIKINQDRMMLSNIDFIRNFLLDCEFSAEKFIEDDGTVTLSLNEIALVENAPTEAEAIYTLAKAILDYAVDFYNNFSFWSSVPSNKFEIPYVFKALVLGNISKIVECIRY